MTTPPLSDSELVDAVTRPDSVHAYVFAALAAELISTRARLAEIEAALPRKGTWIDAMRGFEAWTCECGDRVLPHDQEQAFCRDCGMYRPLPASVAAPANGAPILITEQGLFSTIGAAPVSGAEAPRVGTWRSRSEAFWDCGCADRGMNANREGVPECTECGYDRPALTIAPEYGDGTRASADPSASERWQRMREAAEACVTRDTAQNRALLIAAASPASVLAICDAYDALSGKLDMTCAQWEDRDAELVAERDALAAELAAIKAAPSMTDAAHDLVSKTSAEISRLTHRNAELLEQVSVGTAACEGLEHERDRLATELAQVKRGAADDREAEANARANLAVALGAPHLYRDRIAALVRHWREEDRVDALRVSAGASGAGT